MLRAEQIVSAGSRRLPALGGQKQRFGAALAAGAVKGGHGDGRGGAEQLRRKRARTLQFLLWRRGLVGKKAHAI